jgi:glycosyltransferase involved in cell wall biosynthesis
LLGLERQTFKDFETLILDESTDDCPKIIQKIIARLSIPVRFISIRNVEGIAGALNQGIDEARGEYLARLDADDVPMPERLRLQVQTMEADQRIGLLGSNVQNIDEHGRVLRKPAWTGKELVPLNWVTLWQTALAHPSVMIRAEVLKFHGLRYRNVPAEDADLWCRMALVTRFMRLPEVLLQYRISHGSLFHGNVAKNVNAAMEHSYRLACALHGRPTAVPFEIHRLGTIYSQDVHLPVDSSNFRQFISWGTTLLEDASRYWGWDQHRKNLAIEYSIGRWLERWAFFYRDDQRGMREMLEVARDILGIQGSAFRRSTLMKDYFRMRLKSMMKARWKVKV